MNRLFWKFFTGLLLAQITTAAVVVSMIWFKDAPHLRQADGGHTPETQIVEQPAQRSMASLVPPPPPQSGRHGPRLPVRPLVIGIFTSLLFAYFFARYFSRPIAALKQGFQEVGAGRLDCRISPALKGRRDELADLGRAFDQTVTQLDSLINSQKRLLHDVSHEVRSPLARMQLAIDLLEQQPERQSELLQRISRESARINALMADVLTLARLETAVAWPMGDQIDLVELVEEVVGDVRFEAAEKPCRLQAELPEAPVFLHGNAELLHRALENILRNAIRYTASGTAVTIVVHAQADAWCIEICDEGPGIPESRLAHIFEPFERASQTEAGQRDQGYGLGLAIAAQTIKMHRGVLAARNKTHQDGGTGLCVWMSLPKSGSILRHGLNAGSQIRD